MAIQISGTVRANAGFTLIELMMVIAILAIVGAITIPERHMHSSRADRVEALPETDVYPMRADSSIRTERAGTHPHLPVESIALDGSEAATTSDYYSRALANQTDGAPAHADFNLGCQARSEQDPYVTRISPSSNEGAIGSKC